MLDRVSITDLMWRFRRKIFATVVFCLAFVVPLTVTLVLTGASSASPEESKNVIGKAHRIVFQVNSNEPAAMKHAITNSLNAIRNYREKKEPVAIEIVAYGSGVHMFRADTSPVKDLLQFLHVNNRNVTFSMCGSSKMIMEKNEGHPLTLVDGAQVVPFGVVRLVELQEAGWSYLRP